MLITLGLSAEYSSTVTYSMSSKHSLILSIILDTFFSNRMKYRKQKVEEKADSSVYAAKAY